MGRKILFVVVGIFTALAIVTFYNNAYAGGEGGNHGCPPGQEKKGWKCVDIPGGSGDIDIENKNTNTNLNLNETNVKNNIHNKNENTNWNDVVVEIDVKNKVKQGDLEQNQSQLMEQGQEQGQNQGQDQGQDQGQSQTSESVSEANNAGNTQDTTVVVKGDKIKYEAQPNHINPVDGADTNADTVASLGHDAKVFGSVMDELAGMLAVSAKKLASSASDVVIAVSVFHEPEYSTDYIYIGKSGAFAGFLYAECDGRKCNAAGMEGSAMLKAAQLGYTHIERAYESEGEDLKGSEFSAKIGGGASVAASGGKMIIAPGGGIGGGWAHSDSQVLPAMVFKVYSDPLFITIK